jgi:hypothetical protein
MRRGAPPKPQKEKMKISNSTAKQVEEEDMKRATMQPVVTGTLAGDDNYHTILDVPAGKGEIYNIALVKSIAQAGSTLKLTIDNVEFELILLSTTASQYLYTLGVIGGTNGFVADGITSSFGGTFNINFGDSLKIELLVPTGEDNTYKIVYGLEQ